MCVCVSVSLCARALAQRYCQSQKSIAVYLHRLACRWCTRDAFKAAFVNRRERDYKFLSPPSAPLPPFFGGHKRACVAVLNTVKQCHHIHRARQLQQLSCVTRFVQFTQTGVVTVANIIGSILLVWLKCFTTRLLTLHVFPHCNPARRPC